MAGFKSPSGAGRTKQMEVWLLTLLMGLAFIQVPWSSPRVRERLEVGLRMAIDRDWQPGEAAWYRHARSDLNELIRAQQEYFAGAHRFARSAGEAHLKTFADVETTVQAGANWWTATSTNRHLGLSCVAYHGPVPSGPPVMLAGQRATIQDLVYCGDRV